jgi:hypothetical protein
VARLWTRITTGGVPIPADADEMSIGITAFKAGNRAAVAAAQAGNLGVHVSPMARGRLPPQSPIVATGRTYGYAVITPDGELRRFARAGHIELVEC